MELLKNGQTVIINEGVARDLLKHGANSFIRNFGGEEHTIEKIHLLTCSCGGKNGDHQEPCIISRASHKQRIRLVDIKGSFSAVFFKPA